mgnify:CR=1 FL=1
MSRYRPSMPPVTPYTGALEPDEPDEPTPVRRKVDEFLNSIKGSEVSSDVPFRDVPFRDEKYASTPYGETPYGSMRFIPEGSLDNYLD